MTSPDIPEREPARERPRWLDRPGNVDKIYWLVVAACALLFLADAFYEKHPAFEIEHVFGFYGIFGFVACVGLVLAAKELRKLLMRGEDHYDADDGGKDGS